MTILRFPKALELNPRLEKAEPLQRCDWPACGGACCLHGVWLDPLEVDDLRAHAQAIAPHLPAERRNPSTWFGEAREGEPGMPSGEVVPARVVRNAAHYGGQECVFLRADAKCALQVAGEDAGLHPWRFKPFHCILHPLTLDDDGRVSLAENDELLAEPASCLRRAAKPQPLRELFARELDQLQALTHSDEQRTRGRP